MPTFETIFSYKEKVEGYEVVQADDKEHAENMCRQYINEFYPEALDVEIKEVNELNG